MPLRSSAAARLIPLAMLAALTVGCGETTDFSSPPEDAFASPTSKREPVIIYSAQVFFDAIRRYEFAEVPQALLQRQLDEMTGQDLPPVADIEVRAVVDRRTGRRLGVGSVFLVLEPEAVTAPTNQEREVRPLFAGLEYQPVRLAGKKAWITITDAFSYLVLFPADNTLVTLEGTKASRVIDVARAIARVRL